MADKYVTNVSSTVLLLTCSSEQHTIVHCNIAPPERCEHHANALTLDDHLNGFRKLTKTYEESMESLANHVSRQKDEIRDLQGQHIELVSLRNEKDSWIDINNVIIAENEGFRRELDEAAQREASFKNESNNFQSFRTNMLGQVARDRSVNEHLIDQCYTLTERNTALIATNDELQRERERYWVVPKWLSAVFCCF